MGSTLNSKAIVHSKQARGLRVLNMSQGDLTPVVCGLQLSNAVAADGLSSALPTVSYGITRGFTMFSSLWIRPASFSIDLSVPCCLKAWMNGLMMVAESQVQRHRTQRAALIEDRRDVKPVNYR